MKVFLMYPDRDFDLKRPFPVNEPLLSRDLELNTLFNVMALDDELMLQVVKKDDQPGTRRRIS
jgi:hypothetical protein